jgi:hypothetical protein
MAARRRWDTAHSVRSVRGGRAPLGIGSILQAVLQRYGVERPASVQVVQTPAETHTAPRSRNGQQGRLF